MSPAEQPGSSSSRLTSDVEKIANGSPAEHPLGGVAPAGATCASVASDTRRTRTVCGATTALPSTWRGPSTQAVCTLGKHDDRDHIDNYLGGYRWTTGDASPQSASDDERTSEATP